MPPFAPPHAQSLPAQWSATPPRLPQRGRSGARGRGSGAGDRGSGIGSRETEVSCIVFRLLTPDPCPPTPDKVARNMLWSASFEEMQE